MTTVFITGDRGLPAGHPVVIASVATEIIRAQAHGDFIATGMENGIEEVVRAFGAETGCVTTLVAETPRGDDGKRDYVQRYTDILAANADVRFVFVGDPMACTNAKVLLASFSDTEDRVTLAM